MDRPLERRQTNTCTNAYFPLVSMCTHLFVLWGEEKTLECVFSRVIFFSATPWVLSLIQRKVSISFKTQQNIHIEMYICFVVRSKKQHELNSGNNLVRIIVAGIKYRGIKSTASFQRTKKLSGPLASLMCCAIFFLFSVYGLATPWMKHWDMKARENTANKKKLIPFYLFVWM